MTYDLNSGVTISVTTSVTATMPQLNQLQQHFDAQRRAAYQLIEQQNNLLSSLINNTVPSGNNIVAQSPMPQAVEAVSIKQGNVISLFDYADQQSADKQSVGQHSSGQSKDDQQQSDTSDGQSFNVFNENDTDALAKWGDDVVALLSTYGADDALAINRKQMAATIFLNADLNGLFYFKNQFDVLFAVCYVGADENYLSTLTELKAYAKQNDLLINLMAHENRVEDLKTSGFSTTPMGIWQRIEPVSEFTLAGSKMRRLRYLVSKYVKLGDCKTIEYHVGENTETDNMICTVIDQWCELKETEPTYIPEVKERILKADFNKDHRFFLTYRDSHLDNVMMFSRDNMNDGYLMDLEFYAKGLPLGSTEFALSEIIKCFTEEGRNVASLGLTMGTGLYNHDNASEDVANLFDSLRKADYLNGDANAQYKNKYRPITTTMYLARPNGCGKKKLNDLMMLLGAG
jgi:hypothetical protein